MKQRAILGFGRPTPTGLVNDCSVNDSEHLSVLPLIGTVISSTNSPSSSSDCTRWLISSCIIQTDAIPTPDYPFTFHWVPWQKSREVKYIKTYSDSSGFCTGQDIWGITVGIEAVWHKCNLENCLVGIRNDPASTWPLCHSNVPPLMSSAALSG